MTSSPVHGRRGGEKGHTHVHGSTVQSLNIKKRQLQPQIDHTVPDRQGAIRSSLGPAQQLMMGRRGACAASRSLRRRSAHAWRWLQLSPARPSGSKARGQETFHTFISEGKPACCRRLNCEKIWFGAGAAAPPRATGLAGFIAAPIGVLPVTAAKRGAPLGLRASGDGATGQCMIAPGCLIAGVEPTSGDMSCCRSGELRSVQNMEGVKSTLVPSLQARGGEEA